MFRLPPSRRPAGEMPLLLLLLFAGLLLSTVAARAQAEELHLDPPLNEAMPLEDGPGGVHLAFPVLLNDHTVLKPDSTLRLVFVDNSAGTRSRGDNGGSFRSQVGPGGTLTRDDSNGGQRHGEGPASAWGNNDTDDNSSLFDTKKDESKNGKKELQTEVWRQKDAFSEAFAHAADTGTTIVYLPFAGTKPLTTAIDLPEGMLLGEVDGHVRVLGLTADSRPRLAGVQTGDEIRSFGDGTPLLTLEDFIRAYRATRNHAKVSGDPSYAIDIFRAGQVTTLHVAAPPSIPSFL